MEEMTLTETETTELDKLELVPFTDPKLREVPQDFDFEKEDAKELKDKLANLKLTSRWLPDSSITTYFGKPAFCAYGYGNTEPTFGGAIYG